MAKVKKQRASRAVRQRREEQFQHVKLEGFILPIEVLDAVAADGDWLPGMRPEDFHLLPGEPINERITESWNKLKRVWKIFQKKRANVPKDDFGTELTRSAWLIPLLECLGYSPSYQAKSVEVDGKEYRISHTVTEPIGVNLVSFKQSLNERDTSSKAGARVSPHSMMQEFLNKSDLHLWAFLSNGLQFRILRVNASFVRGAYLEFDLEGIMESDSFGEFAILFKMAHQSRVESRMATVQASKSKNKKVK